jgi:hypothetical protein
MERTSNHSEKDKSKLTCVDPSPLGAQEDGIKHSLNAEHAVAVIKSFTVDL